ncbi:MAG: hypothetical protein K2Q27_13260 [Novosphingobium sp.]|nr:hypothetical protein [Novosphingobium sp.]
MRMSSKALMAATFAALCLAVAAPVQNVLNCNFTSPHRGNTYVYAELGCAIPGTPLSVHSHIAHTGGGFPKESTD